ncbi:hypothetical protein AKJ56_00505 [candidate division MSBL1 archaeon SCGC-AAA382N08]|uniref:Uncharacterized protein n=1 Tax=candidate division MSBL1 archaeon SCGC-AAA382N08 TaxID=1698285 RepID=A0A133VQL4_9EURY|nr:hypothetical protein AKJ56_00505 [candidate division MSBL1 archaeon SCGC-AAA382N08]
MKAKEYVEQFSQILQIVNEKSWSENVNKTEVALAILRELGKDRRMEIMRKEREQAKEQPATEKQKQYMDDLDIVYSENITKEEASEEIERALSGKSK